MSSDLVVILRVALLVTAAMQLALSTVFFEPIQERMVRPMLRTAETQGASLPTAMRWFLTSRIPAVAMTAVPLGMAWFVGTPAAAALLERLRAGA